MSRDHRRLSAGTVFMLIFTALVLVLFFLFWFRFSAGEPLDLSRVTTQLQPSPVPAG